MKVNFFKPYITGYEIVYIKDLLDHRKDLSGDGEYTKKCQQLLEKRYGVPKVLLTTSGTTALEMAVRILGLKTGDEIIVPSFTFSSTANAVLMQSGLKVVFAEINQETLNIDPSDIEKKITLKTKAIIAVHYAGVAADMGKIMLLAKKHKLFVIEDAAQAIESKYKNKFLGTIGNIGCLSFHDTKNIICGEGGAIFINTKSEKLVEKAEIIREKGTNRSKFFRGQIDKYTWVDIGSSYLPSEILAAFLLAQLELVEEITVKRKEKYNYYRNELSKLHNKVFKLPCAPNYATGNAHIFYVIFKHEKQRNFVLDYLRKNNIGASFHYIPLHSSPEGKKLGYKKSDFPVTNKISGCLLRLPMYADLTKNEQDFVIATFKDALVKMDRQYGK